MEREYTVRIPNDTKKKFHVMRFGNLDLNQLRNCKMEREVMFKETTETTEQECPEFGAGSEFGRKEREQARRKKFEKRKQKSENSPWILQVGGKNGKKYRGIREGGVTDNASYYVFFQSADGVFEAFPVKEWYNFSPYQRYKTMSAEEAEEQYLKRDQILNFFPLRMAKNKAEGDKDDFGSGSKAGSKIKKEFKVSDMDDWDNLSENELSERDSEDEEKYKPKDKKIKKEKRNKKKKDSDEEEEEEALEDSDEGDYDDKEVDYISDESSSSGSDLEEKGVDLKGVEDETGLRDLTLSDEEDQEAEKDKEKSLDNTNESDGKPLADGDGKKAKQTDGDNDSHSESDFGSDMSDVEEQKLGMYFQKSVAAPAKQQQQPTVTPKTEPSADESAKSSASGLSHRHKHPRKTESEGDDGRTAGLKFKHKLVNLNDSEQSTTPLAKKAKVHHGVTEEAVRRYLARKPMTAADLVQKFKNKAAKLDELTGTLAEILRKINPDKQNIKGKMYLSLKPT